MLSRAALCNTHFNLVHRKLQFGMQFIAIWRLPSTANPPLILPNIKILKTFVEIIGIQILKRLVA